MLVYLCFKPTRSYHTQGRTQRIIFLSLSVAKVANDRVGSGEFRVPHQMFSPPLFGPIRWCHHLPQSTHYSRFSPRVATAPSRRYLFVILTWLHHKASSANFIMPTDGHGIWFVKVQSWINSFLFLITRVNIEISLNKHQLPTLSRVFLKVMDHSWNRSAALNFFRPLILWK